MTISETLLPEFDHEFANTRTTLERVPEDKLEWQPHTKSMTMTQLASHLAEIAGWAATAVETDSLDMNPPEGRSYTPLQAKSREELLKAHDENVAKARAALAGASDEHLLKPWSLLSGGQPVLTMPRTAVIRTFVLSHSIHHRAQLGVYLRLNDVPVPAVYGPSADENPM